MGMCCDRQDMAMKPIKWIEFAKYGDTTCYDLLFPFPYAGGLALHPLQMGVGTS